MNLSRPKLQPCLNRHTTYIYPAKRLVSTKASQFGDASRLQTKDSDTRLSGNFLNSSTVKHAPVSVLKAAASASRTVAGASTLDAPVSNSIDVNQALLKEDDDLLRTIFTRVFRHHHPQLADKIDGIFELSQKCCVSESDSDFQQLEHRLQTLQPDERILVASAFSQLLNLHNITEEIVTARLEKAQRLGEVEQSTRSTNKSLQKMVKEGVSPSAIYEALSKQSVELVFTAHPTQAMRQSMLKKYGKIRSEMQLLHNTRLSPYERLETLDEIQSQIQSAWRTDEIRRSKPSPQDESRQGLAYFQETIYSGLPVFLRRIDTALESIGQPRLPLEATPFSFGSWTGGDRDGNPFVTPQTTRDVVIGSRLSAVNMMTEQVEKLMFELSVWRASPELHAAAAVVSEKYHLSKSYLDTKTNAVDVVLWCMSEQEPYRLVLSEVRDRLNATKEVLLHAARHPTVSLREALEQNAAAYSSEADLIKSLKLCYDSLIACGDDSIANSTLLDVLRQAFTFGLHLCRLDIRQESIKHTEAMEAVTLYLGLGSYKEWSEEQRMEFLLKELQSNRPLLPPGMPTSSEVADVINTFRMLAELPPDSLGAYVISMAHTASDVLCVVLFQKECGVKPLLRVAPLFETLDDLHYAETAMRQLFSNDWYRSLINGTQECMIGYSDSGKDAGNLAASWGLYEVQERLVAVAQEYGIHLTLFHGRGGTVGRGGAPAHLAILSQPPGTVNGTIRVTVQGEVMEQQFGEQEIAFRTLDLYTSAVLEASLVPQPHPTQLWRDTVQKMSEYSCEAYRSVVRSGPFIEFFQSVTPVNELGRMNIGSRPAKRRTAGSIETLRAIPWIFAWTQIRFHLPVWLGIGEALQKVIEQPGGLALLQDMYQNWAFFRVLLDMYEMVFAKADPRVVQLYANHLVDDGLQHLADDLLKRFHDTETLLLQVMNHDNLLSSSSTAFLQQKLQLRAPYVAPLNILQVYSLKELRALEAGTPVEQVAGVGGGEYKPDASALALMSRGGGGGDPFYNAVLDTMVLTMKGIAAGMQNTG